jgi:hypothetical protein
MKKKVKKVKYDDVFVISGTIKVGMADKKGKYIGDTELNLNQIWIKLPRL